MPETTPDPLETLATEEASADNEQPAQPELPAPEATPEEIPQWQQYGFKSPEAMWDAYSNLNSRFNERNDEVGELRKRVAQFEEYAQQIQQPQEQSQFLPDGTPILTQEQLVELREEDPGTYADLMVRYRTADMEARMEDMIRQRLAPIEQAHIQRGSKDVLSGLQAEIGDDVVLRHADLIGQLIRDDRAHYADPKTGVRRLREAVESAEYRALQGGGSPTPQPPGNGQPAPRDVHVEGGSGAAPSDLTRASRPIASPSDPRAARGHPERDASAAYRFGTDY
jgi:hypothetical protein